MEGGVEGGGVMEAGEGEIGWVNSIYFLQYFLILD